MLQRTPNPTAADLRRKLPSVTPNMPAVFEELKARLRADFPTAAQVLNEELGWAGEQAIKPPRSQNNYGLAPLNLTDKFLGHILIGGALTLDTETAQIFEGDVPLPIYIVESKIDNDLDMLQAWGKAGALLLSLKPYLTGCVDEAGTKMWAQLVPVSASVLPEGYGDGYAGVMVMFRIEFSPQACGWPADVLTAAQVLTGGI